MEKEIKEKKKEKKIVVGFWKRLFSDIVDSIFLGVLGLVIVFFFEDFFYTLGEHGLLWGIVITFLYTGILQSSMGKGQSLAKKIFRIQVLRKDGSYLSLSRSFLRYVVIALVFYNDWIGKAIITLVPSLNNIVFISCYNYLFFSVLLGSVILIVFHPLKRGLQDLLVDSIVVRKGQYSAEKIEELENSSKATTVLVVWLVLSLFFIAGMQHFVNIRTASTKSHIQEMSTLAEEITNISGFESVAVMHQWSTGDDKKKVNGIIVNMFLLKAKADDEEFISSEVPKVVEVAKKYSEMQQCDYIRINVRTGFNIGIASQNMTESFVFNNKGEKLGD